MAESKKTDSDGPTRPPSSGWTRWRTIVELSSVATLVSFLLSAGILFSVIERSGVPFSSAVGVNDIVVYGIAQLLSTLTWMIYLSPPAIIGYIGIRFYIISFQSTLRNKSKIWLIFTLIITLIVAGINITIAFFYSQEADSRRTFSETMLTTDTYYVRFINDVGLMWTYGPIIALLLIAYAMEYYLTKKVDSGEEKADSDRFHALTDKMTSYGKIMSMIFLVFSLCQAGYASYSKLERDFTTGVGHLDEERGLGACATGSTLVVNWIGESSLIVRCDGHASVIKGIENIHVNLGLPTPAARRTPTVPNASPSLEAYES